MTGSPLRFEGVHCRFGRRAALQDLVLDCPAGAITCLIGPNGAGKSTALRLAAGLLFPSAGRILLGGRPLRAGDPPPATGYLPQRSAFPALLRAREVLDFAARARRTSEADRADVLQVSGLEAVLDRTVRELSGGWLRRLGIASALLPPAELLLLDEPFVGLEPEILDRLVEHLRRRARAGAVVLLASHDFEVIDLLEARVEVLDEGRLVPGTGAMDGGARAAYRGLLGPRSAPAPPEAPAGGR